MPPGSHRHGDEIHPSDHAHPHHALRRPGEPPIIGIVGAGAVGTALGVALSRAAGRSTRSPAATAAGASGSARWSTVGRAFAEPEPILDEVELIVLAVPDDVVAPLAGSLRMYSGQAMIHTSGALGAEVLAPAMAAGTQVGAFHPLVAFADTERAVAGAPRRDRRHRGRRPARGAARRHGRGDRRDGRSAWPPGSKAAYHAAAVLAAGGFVALLDAIAELGRVAGLDEAGSLAIYGPLIEGTLGNARALGIRAALTGPMTRGDVGTLRAHLDTLRRERTRCPRSLPRRGQPRDRSGRVAGRAGTGGLHEDACRACGGLATPCLNRYHSPPWITASRPGTRPARRPDSSVRPPGSANVVWASVRRDGSMPRGARRPCCTAPRARP